MNIKDLFYKFFLVCICLNFSFDLFGQNDEGFIYGKITTVSGAIYIGQIRWGKEEAFWNDVFNSTKSSNTENTYSKYAQDKKSKDWWDNIDGKILKIWDDTYSHQLHQFSCRFGDIKSIYPGDGEKLVCQLKNGVRINLNGGSNDIGETIIISDYELGKINLHWNKIHEITFENAPKSIEEKLGEPLYGKVLTDDSEFVGFIQWDKDERLSSDLLEGSTVSTKAAIPFGKITRIENLGNSSKVVLHNGKSMVLSGTNDVNKGNRGIIISVEDIGKIEIPWNIFESVQFDLNHNSSGSPYNSYPYPERLTGIVKDLDGNEFDGLIIFDKDEKWDIEQLEGNYKHAKYIIPFRQIKTIIPKNESYSYIILRNEKKLLLGNAQDVSSKNEGIVIIQQDNTEPIYLDWENVDEIHFH